MSMTENQKNLLIRSLEVFEKLDVKFVKDFRWVVSGTSPASSGEAFDYTDGAFSYYMKPSGKGVMKYMSVSYYGKMILYFERYGNPDETPNTITYYEPAKGVKSSYNHDKIYDMWFNKDKDLEYSLYPEQRDKEHQIPIMDLNDEAEQFQLTLLHNISMDDFKYMKEIHDICIQQGVDDMRVISYALPDINVPDYKYPDPYED